MDSFAASVAHYLLVLLQSIGADSVIAFIGKQYRNSYQLNQCLQSQQDYFNSCGDFTMLGYIIILFLVTSIFGRGLFFFTSPSK
jgi:predicted patatin/cPLA2 family phospholipase